MALHFVTTSVLSSADGIDFSTETPLETEDAKQSRLDAINANQKSLYEQLAALQNKKLEQYEENTKLLNGIAPIHNFY